MRFLALVLLVATSPGFAQQMKPAQRLCQTETLQPIGGAPAAGVHKLGEEPPARQIYTVLRSENGCSKPVPVSDRVIGTTPRRR